jgi:hypothetical protein
MQQAQSNISSCFDSWLSIKGCYRFFSNNKIDKNVIIREHQNSTISRIGESTGKNLYSSYVTYFSLVPISRKSCYITVVIIIFVQRTYRSFSHKKNFLKLLPFYHF